MSGTFVKADNNVSKSDKIDKIVTHKYLGLPLFFIIMAVIYYISITSIGSITIGWVENLFGFIGEKTANVLSSLGTSDFVLALIVDGIIGSIGSIFIFVPQLMILFLFLSILEDTGYMARIAFLMDRIFRRFGLSGRSFIPMLIGTGCSIPGVMATRTIEDENDRKMTILLTPFVPCGAKIPVFAMFISILFNQDPWVGPLIYVISFVVIVLSGILLKKTKAFSGFPAPFIMELPDYKLPTLKGLFIHMWDKAKGFIKKAGSIIFVSVTLLWISQNFTWNLHYLAGESIDQSILASLGHFLKYLFIPLGLGDSWAPSVAALTGLIAKEVVVSTLASIGSTIPLYFTKITAFSFILFTIFSAPCFAAIGAMKKELGSTKLVLKAIAFQTGVAYLISTLWYQLAKILLANTSWNQPIMLISDNLEKAAEASILPTFILPVVLVTFVLILLLLTISNRRNKQ